MSTLPPPSPRSGYLMRQFQTGPITTPRDSWLRQHAGHDLRVLHLTATAAKIEPEWEDVTTTDSVDELDAEGKPTGRKIPGEPRPTGERRETGRVLLVSGEEVPVTLIMSMTTGAVVLDFEGVPADRINDRVKELREAPGAVRSATSFDDLERHRQREEQDRQLREEQERRGTVVGGARPRNGKPTPVMMGTTEPPPTP